MLTEEGKHVLGVPSSGAAVAAIESYKPRLIFLGEKHAKRFYECIEVGFVTVITLRFFAYLLNYDN